MKIAKTLAAAIQKSFGHKGDAVHYPGGAISFVDELPAPVGAAEESELRKRNRKTIERMNRRNRRKELVR